MKTRSPRSRMVNFSVLLICILLGITIVYAVFVPVQRRAVYAVRDADGYYKEIDIVELDEFPVLPFFKPGSTGPLPLVAIEYRTLIGGLNRVSFEEAEGS